MKRSMAFALSLILTFSLLVLPARAAFSDITDSTVAQDVAKSPAPPVAVSITAPS